MYYQNFQQNANNRANPRYWESGEIPEIRETSKNALIYYKKAGRLQIRLPSYTVIERPGIDEAREVTKQGKLCGLNLDALRECPEVLDWLIGIFQDLRKTL